jgi:hypothetical protein
VEHEGVRSWLVDVAKRLVDQQEAVAVDVFEEQDAVVLELAVDPDELGRVIGRQGRTVQALRTLLEIAGGKSGRCYELEILE